MVDIIFIEDITSCKDKTSFFEDIILHESWDKKDQKYIRKRLNDMSKKTIEIGEDYIYNDENIKDKNIGKCLIHEKHLNSNDIKSARISIKSLYKTINKNVMDMHRFILFCKMGNISSEILARHRCLTKTCYNPDHIEHGNSKDNANDKKRDGTGTIGENHPNAGLNDEIVKKIFESIDVLSDEEIIKKFNISKSRIFSIKNGWSWTHVTGLTPKPKSVKKPKEEVLQLILKNKEILLKKIKKNTEINENGCWIWQLYLDNDGYGRFGYMNYPFSAHLISWMVKTNEILDTNLVIRHQCVGQRDCCNPEHLIKGTVQENCLDTKRVGENIGTSKLKEPDILEIYKLLEQKEIIAVSIAKKYNVSDTCISAIKSGRAWEHLYTLENYKYAIIKTKEEKEEDKKEKEENKKNKKNKEDKEKDVLEIYKLLEKNTRVIIIADMFNIDTSTISRIKNGKTYKHLYNKENYKDCKEDDIIIMDTGYFTTC